MAFLAPLFHISSSKVTVEINIINSNAPNIILKEKTKMKGYKMGMLGTKFRDFKNKKRTVGNLPSFWIYLKECFHGFASEITSPILSRFFLSASLPLL